MGTSERRIAFLTGATGQDGSYLAEYLLAKNYEVHAVIRRASTFNTARIDHLFVDPHENPAFKLYYGDLADGNQIANLIHKIKPNEVYHLGAQSHVRVSFDLPVYTVDITGNGTVRILEAIRQSDFQCKLYNASSSEMYGDSPNPQNEQTPFRPRSPYACSKALSHWMVGNYREGHGLWCCNGILFNHESPRRGPTFVTRKITMGVAGILAKKQKHIYLGNLESRRDWGYAPEYVEMMWRMLQAEKPQDYAVGTGKTHSVREFVEASFAYAGLNHENHIRIDERYFRPTEVEELRADSRKAKKELGWNPKITFEDLVKVMVDEEMRRQDLKPIGEGDALIERKFPARWWRDDIRL